MGTPERQSKNQPEFDEHVQESFSDDYANVYQVASWHRNSAERLTLNFHNGWIFDADLTKTIPDRLKSAINELKRIS